MTNKLLKNKLLLIPDIRLKFKQALKKSLNNFSDFYHI